MNTEMNLELERTPIQMTIDNLRNTNESIPAVKSQIAELLSTVDTKLSNSRINILIQTFMKTVKLFPANEFSDDIKQKRMDIIVTGSKIMYPFHWLFLAPYHNIQSSVILVCNEVIIKHFVEECAEFAACLLLFNNKQQQIKHIPELVQYYKHQNIIKEKDIITAMLDDLEQWHTLYFNKLDLPVLKQQSVKDFQSIKISKIESITNLMKQNNTV